MAEKRRTSIVSRRPRRAWWLALAGAGLLLLLTACDVDPDRDFVVDTTDDLVDVDPGDGACRTATNECSLRAAVQEANSRNRPSRIDLGDRSYTLGLAGRDEDAAASGDLDILSVATDVVGDGATIDGAGIDRIFHVATDAHLNLYGVTVRGGSTDGAGGGALAEGNVYAERTTFTGNEAARGGAVAGAAKIVLNGSTVAANRAVAGDGGGIDGDGVVVALNTTVSGNEATGVGGGLHVGTDGEARLDSATVTANGATDGAGIASVSEHATNATFLANSIVAANVATTPGTPSSNCRTATADGRASTVTSTGFNVSDDDTCALGEPSDQPSVDPQLGPLADHGGPTPTHEPAASSPAIDAGYPVNPAYPTCLPVDQRGEHRPRDGDGDGTASCDSGAVEVATAFPLVVDAAHDAVDAAVGDGVCDDGTGACTLRAAVQEANARSGADTVAIAAGIDPVLALAGRDTDQDGGPADAATGDLDVFDDLVLEGNGATVDAAGLDRALAVRSTNAAQVVLDHLTITGGVTDASGGAVLVQAGARLDGSRLHLAGNDGLFLGGGIHAVGELHLRDTTVSGGQAGLGGGIAVTGGAPAVLDQVTVTGNLASFAGGVYHPGTAVELRNSTVTANTGGGLASFDVASRLSNTVVADQLSGSDCFEPTTSDGANLDSDGTCLGSPAAGDRTVADAGLLRLDDHGGPVPTHLPTHTSPLVDLGAPSCPGTDQRGALRPEDGNNDGTTACDTGAVEADRVVALDLVVDTPTDLVDVAPGDGRCRTSEGTCSLRAAVQEVNANPTNFTLSHTVTIADGVDPTLTTPGVDVDGTDNPADTARGDVDVFEAVLVEGGGATIDAGGLDRALSIRSQLGEPVELRDLTITGGTTGRFGGGIRVATSSMVGRRLHLVDNSADVGGGLYGVGSVRLYESTVDGNTATRGGGLYLTANFVVEVVSSTISGNTATLTVAPGGGGIHHGGDDLVVRSSTITANTGGGVHSDTSPRAFENSVVADQATGLDCTGPSTSLQYNVDSDGTCFAAGSPNNRRDVGDARLGPLGDHGGPTPTHQPEAGSPVRDTAFYFCPATDQRGAPRPVDGDADGVAACDSGAVEAPALPALDLVVDTAVDAVDVAVGDGVCATATTDCSLRAAVQEANARGTADRVTIAAGVDPVLSLPAAVGPEAAHGDLDVTDDITVEGGGATVSGGAGWATRLVEVPSGAGVVVLRGLTLTGGSETAGFGGAVLNQAELTLEQEEVTANRAASGGGVRNSAGVLRIDRSTIAGNTATGDLGGGGVYSTAAGTVTIVQSTVSGNAATHASAPGGGVRATGAATIEHSTIVGNTAGAGGRGLNLSGANTVRASIVTAPSGSACGGAVGSGGSNVTSDATCGSATGDLPSTDPLLGPLADHGGPTPTHLPTAASPALDLVPDGLHGCGTTVLVDQRGVGRPVGSGCDAGSVERADEPAIVGLPATVYTTSGPTDLEGDPEGGTFAGPGITGATFDPAVAGVGTHVVSYATLDGRSTAAAVEVLGVEIEGPSALDAEGPAATYTPPLGTTLSGPGVTVAPDGTAMLDPGAAGGPGTATLTATGPMCPGGATCSVTRSIALVGFSAEPPALVASSGPGVALQALPAGGTFAGPGVSGSTFAPGSAGGAGHKTVTYTYDGVTVSRSIEVFQVTLTYAQTNCSGTLQEGLICDYVFTGTPAGGTYSPQRTYRIISTSCPRSDVTVTYAGTHRGVAFSISRTIPGVPIDQCRKPT